jgi:hypothetical protein
MPAALVPYTSSSTEPPFGPCVAGSQSNGAVCQRSNSRPLAGSNRTLGIVTGPPAGSWTTVPAAPSAAGPAPPGSGPAEEGVPEERTSNAGFSPWTSKKIRSVRIAPASPWAGAAGCNASSRRRRRGASRAFRGRALSSNAARTTSGSPVGAPTRRWDGQIGATSNGAGRAFSSKLGSIQPPQQPPVPWAPDLATGPVGMQPDFPQLGATRDGADRALPSSAGRVTSASASAPGAIRCSQWPQVGAARKRAGTGLVSLCRSVSGSARAARSSHKGHRQGPLFALQQLGEDS